MVAITLYANDLTAPSCSYNKQGQSFVPLPTYIEFLTWTLPKSWRSIYSGRSLRKIIVMSIKLLRTGFENWAPPYFAGLSSFSPEHNRTLTFANNSGSIASSGIR